MVAQQRWDGTSVVAGWDLVRQVLDDMVAMIRTEAETALELAEGMRVLARITALSAQVALDVDHEQPWFFAMNTQARYVGGPNPDGAYHLAMIDGHRRYRVTGVRGTSRYLGIQVLAGRGLTPRRHAAHISDRDLVVDGAGRFSIVFSGEKPSEAELAGGSWVEIPDDASALNVRQYVADAETEALAALTIEPLDPVGAPPLPSDETIGEQLTAFGWTIAKLATLHHSIKPELLDRPNELLTAEAAELGSAETTPDNLYVIGTYRLRPDEALVIDLEPPATRYWSITAENIWHECIDVGRRASSLTDAHAQRRPDGTVRAVLAGDDPRVPNWLDTGGRHRGFVIVRWLDNPAPPALDVRVAPLAAVATLP